MNECFIEALGFFTYRLEINLGWYDDDVSRNIAKWATCVQVRVKPETLNPYYFISIISFFLSFEVASDTNGVHEGEALYLLHCSWEAKPIQRRGQESSYAPTRSISTKEENPYNALGGTRLCLGSVRSRWADSDTEIGVMRLKQPPNSTLIEKA